MLNVNTCMLSFNFFYWNFLNWIMVNFLKNLNINLGEYYELNDFFNEIVKSKIKIERWNEP